MNETKNCSGRVLAVKREVFIERAQKIHGNRYDYSVVQFLNYSTPISIICSTHGKFKQTPSSHLNSLIPCPLCDNGPRRGFKKSNRVVGERKRIRESLLEEVDGKRVWVGRYVCCGKKKFFSIWRNLTKFNQRNDCCVECNSNRRRKYFVGKGPWIKKCIDCQKDVVYTTKLGYVSKTPCRCKEHRTEHCMNQSFKFRPYIFSDGRTEMVQGYEPMTINHLISSSIDPSDIRLKYSEKPKIQYEYSGSHIYIPDAYISSSNVIVETKSTWTWNNDVDKNLAKVKATVMSGHNMRVIIWDKKKLVIDRFLQKR